MVNEKAQLEEQRREFQRQRNGDIIRMREEAEHLERCLQQVEQSHKALERTRKELEERHRELDELHDQLILHETNYLKHSQGFLWTSHVYIHSQILSVEWLPMFMFVFMLKFIQVSRQITDWWTQVVITDPKLHSTQPQKYVIGIVNMIE